MFLINQHNLPEYYYPMVDNKYPNVDNIKFEDQENTNP